METLEAALAGAKKLLNKYRSKSAAPSLDQAGVLDQATDTLAATPATIPADQTIAKPRSQKTTTLGDLKNRLITNYDLTKFEYEVKDPEHKSYIDFICKRNLAYNAAKNNNLKDFIARYSNVIAAFPSLAIAAIKQYYKAALLAKNDYFFDFISKTLLPSNSNHASHFGGNLLPDHIRVSMLEHYLFNSYDFYHNHTNELNAVARLTNSLLWAATSSGLADQEVAAVNAIVAAIMSKSIAHPTKLAIEELIKQDPGITGVIKNNILSHKMVVGDTAKQAVSI